MTLLKEPATGVYTGPEGLPERTLGWDGLGWSADYLLQPDGPDAGDPWRFTDEQARFLLWFYAIDERGKFLYRYAMLRRLKGHGKDPLAVAIANIEALGPCRFGGWKKDGSPLAVPHYSACVLIAAVSQDQVKRNTMSLFPMMISRRAIEEYGIDMGKEIIYAHGGRCRIEMLTTSARSAEGPRPTFILKNEALATNTLLPTPSGWTTVGEVEAGDILYGSKGPVRVVKATPVYVDRPCYRVTFEDGTSLVADEGHLWYAKRTSSAAKPRIWSTSEMLKDGRGLRRFGFMVPLVEPLTSPEVPLPVDPYVLGLWLGDGDARAAGITVGKQDADEALTLVRAGGLPSAQFTRTIEGHAKRISLRGNRDGQLYTKDGSSFRGGLVELGVLGAKRIPTRYLRASRFQRLALLQGLMDSDGCISEKQGQAIFVNQNELLARGLLELVRSLGYRASIKSSLDQRWGQPLMVWRVVFQADERTNPFRLSRKASKVARKRRPWKAIVAIEPVQSVPVRCIEVDSPDHLFVAGDGWTLTHNTHHWLASNGGHEMAAVVARNAAKSRDGSTRVLAISNAHAPGEDSDAERDYEAYRLGAKDILYDSREAPDVPDLNETEALREALLYARGDSVWLDIDRLIAEIQDPRVPESEARRFYLNQLAASADRAFDADQWASLAAPKVVQEGAQIALGFDGSINRDHTALIGTELATGYQWVVGYWEPQEVGGDWRIPEAEVDETVAAAFERWAVERFYVDPPYWREHLARWEGAYNRPGKSIVAGWPTNSYRRMAASLVEYRKAIDGGDLSHDGDQRFADGIRNAHKKYQAFVNEEGEKMWTICKERPDSPLKIDAAMAACLSWQARNDAIADGVLGAHEESESQAYAFGTEDDE